MSLMERIFDADHCSRWEGIPQDKLADENRRHIAILCKAFACGPYNLPVAWNRVDWRDLSAEFPIRTWGMASFDNDTLTRLVLVSHDEGVRAAIFPRTFRELTVALHTRPAREGRLWERHPTIEQAVADWRKG